jgi:hypothetical protein
MTEVWVKGSRLTIRQIECALSIRGRAFEELLPKSFLGGRTSSRAIVDSQITDKTKARQEPRPSLALPKHGFHPKVLAWLFPFVQYCF